MIRNLFFRSRSPSLRKMQEAVADLEQRLAGLRGEQDRLTAILDGMIEGVLVTNERREIVLVNPALRSMLSFEGTGVGKTILEYVRNRTIADSIEAALREGRPNESEVSLLIRSEEKHLILHTVPLLKEERPAGAVSVFYDATNLRRLENIRREFVANVSHELKTPLTSILGYAETLRRGAIQDREAAARFVEKIEGNAIQLKNLVEDILKLSEIESGRMEIRSVSVDLEDFITTIQADFEDKLRAKRLTFERKVEKWLTIHAEPATLRQILGNLIDNSIKYTPEGGMITVAAKSTGHSCKITVADTGIGISEKDLPHVFERFYRVDKARSRQMGGTGLGLAIVKHLVQVQGGEVGVQSELDKGSEFWFTVPLS